MTRARPDDAAAGGGSPAAYVEVASPVGTWLSRPGLVGAIAAGGVDDLLSNAGPRRQAAGGGRGPLIRLRLGGQEAIAKRPVHGGLVGRMCGGLYWGRERVLAQLRAAQRLRADGVRTPDILAAGWRSVAGPLHRHAIIASAIQGAINLYEALRNPPPGLSRRAILEQSALVVRRMHDARFLHADLNITNLVVEPLAAGVAVHIVDLDRGRFRGHFDLGDRARNLARLLRSYEKWLAGEAPLSDREEFFFLRCYAGSDREMVRWLWRFLQSYRRSLGARRFVWRLRAARVFHPRGFDRQQ
ncbi:MAG TPA: lipopolysaccharide kinase InaA family protein [Candidatus Polarisedimenticolia bacterium]|nr:lipopolysaccharide kinase InaA family protein [Candidatus Polarisedimenticolia bacterium]